MTKKIRLIYLPFLGIAIGFIVLYTFLHWLLFIKTNTLSIKEDILNFWLPFGLPWIPILLWLRPRIKLLKLKDRKGNLPFLYQFIAAMAIAVPTIVAQSYIETASGVLTPLENINQINKQEQTKYYTLKNFYIDKLHIGVHPSFEVNGKYNENFNMHLYVVLPILESAADTLNSNCSAWMGIEYSKNISNRLDEKEKEEKYQEFTRESQEIFNNTNVNQFIYLDRVANSDAGDGYKEASEKCLRYKSNNAAIFVAKNEPFEDRNGNKLGWIFGAFCIGGGIWLLMLLIPSLEESEVHSFENGNPLPSDKEAQRFIGLLKPKEKFYITPILIYLNVFVFLIMVFDGLGFISFKTQDLLRWGANYRPLTANGEWWRLLTGTFLHGGLMHLIANMYGLLFVGIFLEPLLGRKKYLIAYLLTGILASCASLWWYDATVSVGASGAIFGLYGLFLALLLTKVFPPNFSKAFLASTLVFIGFNLFIGMTTGGIDNAAHIGGLSSGFIIGLILYPTLNKQAEEEPIMQTNE